MALALPPPPDYMGLAICATLFFFPLGLCAIRLSQKVGLFPGLLIVFQYLVWYTVVPLRACGLEVSDHMRSMPHGKYATWEIHGRSYLVVFHHSIINVVLEPKKTQNIHFFTFAQVTTKTCCNYIVIINIQSHIALAKPKTVSAYEVVSFPDQSGNKDVSFPDWSGNETVTPGPEVRGCGKTVMCDCHK